MARGMTVSLEFTGDKEAERILATLIPKEAKKAVKKSLRESGKYLKAKVRRETPRGKTGFLRRSIIVRTAKQRSGKSLPRGMFGIAVKTKPEAYYGFFLEFGTTHRFTRKTGAYRGILAAYHGGSGWLAPVAYRNESKVIKFFKRNLRNRMIALGK